ncbi:hypothetical protein AXF42_Ash015735 [Apostasia shenzhenica]|uniref:Uncharacterized protein n=1 Tax=Apostasia shenzhenica TaxID=1088818 RepID=A0A2H9ZU67_9ASPA|nr:hypothetical protein AXF42_Ash015735 [Apostasia shenzhenica]
MAAGALLSLLIIASLLFLHPTATAGAAGQASNIGQLRRPRAGSRLILEDKPKKGDHCTPASNNVCPAGTPGRGGIELLSCCKNHCRDVLSDRNNCGGCGGACGFGQLCCNGRCTAVAYDVNNCGECGTVCRPGDRCEYGSCGYAKHSNIPSRSLLKSSSSPVSLPQQVLSFLPSLIPLLSLLRTSSSSPNDSVEVSGAPGDVAAASPVRVRRTVAVAVVVRSAAAVAGHLVLLQHAVAQKPATLGQQLPAVGLRLEAHVVAFIKEAVSLLAGRRRHNAAEVPCYVRRRHHGGHLVDAASGGRVGQSRGDRED